MYGIISINLLVVITRLFASVFCAVHLVCFPTWYSKCIPHFSPKARWKMHFIDNVGRFTSSINEDFSSELKLMLKNWNNCHKFTKCIILLQIVRFDIQLNSVWVNECMWRNIPAKFLITSMAFGDRAVRSSKHCLTVPRLDSSTDICNLFNNFCLSTVKSSLNLLITIWNSDLFVDLSISEWEICMSEYNKEITRCCALDEKATCPCCCFFVKDKFVGCWEGWVHS